MTSEQVGERTTNVIRRHLISRIRIPIRLCFLHVHSPGICLLLAIGSAIKAVAEECMCDAQVIN